MNLDGTLDSSFHTYSVGQLDSDVDPISAVFFQPDGSILAEIISSTDGQQFLRFSSTGALDPNSVVPFRIPAPVTKLVSLPDGKLLAAGDFNFVDGAKPGPLARFGADGNLDATFHPLTFGALTTAVDLSLQNSGGILFSLVNYDNVVAVQEFNLRLTPTGNVDSTFASQNLEPIFRVAPDDKIITSGNYSVVQRLLGDGNIDSAFAPTQVYFQANFQT